MPLCTDAGETVKQLKSSQVSCLCAFDFFGFAASALTRAPYLCTHVSERLPAKKWLFDLSKDKPSMGTSLEQFFDDPSLFTCIQKSDQIRTSFDYLSPAHLRPGIMFQRDENLND